MSGLVRRPYLWLTLAVLAVYGRTLFFGLTFLDDNALILDDFAFLSGGWRNLFEIFRRDAFHSAGPGAYYRPLYVLSFFIDAHWTGQNPAGYHFTNVVLHAGACALLYRLLLVLEIAAEPAFYGVLLFAVHPALAQAVCWIPARNDALLGVFVFAGFAAFARWLKHGAKRELAALLACFALALLTKETAVVLPIAFAGWALLDSSNARARRWGPALISGAAVVLAWYALRSAALRDPLRLAPDDVLLSLWAGKLGMLQYLGKAILPFKLSVLSTVRDTGAALGLLSTAALIAAIVARRPSKKAAFGLAWFALFMLPTMILRSTTFDLATEQRLYVPLAGLIIAGLSWMPGAARVRRFALPAAALFAILAFRYSAHFRDQRAFWASAAETSPNLPLAHRNLGAILFLDGKLDEAAVEYRKALAINPVEPMAHNNLGLVYMNQGRNVEAEAEYRRELELYPAYDNALYNLGLLYARTGHVREAAALWRRVLEVNPRHPDAARELRALGAR